MSVNDRHDFLPTSSSAVSSTAVGTDGWLQQYFDSALVHLDLLLLSGALHTKIDICSFADLKVLSFVNTLCV